MNKNNNITRQPFVNIGKQNKLYLNYSYYGYPTSSIDWCEPNYKYSGFIAEFFNSWTTLFYVIAGILIIMDTRKTLLKKHHQRFNIMGLGIIIVGIGSFIFHATLKRWAQLLDEFPMFVCVMGLFYHFICHNENCSTKKTIMTIVTLSLISSLVLIWMIFFPGDPYDFFNLFGFLFGLVWLIELMRGILGGNKKKWKNKFYGSFMFIFWFCSGQIFWTIENEYCSTVDGPLYFFHSIWHLLTAISCYVKIRHLMYIFYVDNGYIVEYNVKHWLLFDMKIIKQKKD